MAASIENDHFEWPEIDNDLEDVIRKIDWKLPLPKTDCGLFRHVLSKLLQCDEIPEDLKKVYEAIAKAMDKGALKGIGELLRKAKDLLKNVKRWAK